MKVNAAQHVSAVLTSKQSRKGRGGYQTLFYTRERLGEDEMHAIEHQVQYGSARDGRAKWQSYRLTPRRHVISRIIPIAEPDEFGRRGRFFTHSLLFDTNDGQLFDESLFDLLSPRNFLSSLDDVLASEGLKSGDIPPLSLDAGGEWVKEAQRLMRDWPGEQLNQLYMLVSDPRQLIEQGQYVTLLGTESQILDALKVAFLLTPPSARKFCSFDTNSPGAEAQSSLVFWGRGNATRDTATSYMIDAAERRVTMPESSKLRANGFSPERVSSPLRNAIASHLGRPSEQMLRCLVNRKYASFIGEPVYRALLHAAELSPSATDLEMLTPFRSRHHGLDLLLALRLENESHRLQLLAAMDSSSYREQARELRAMPGFKPWQVFSPVFVPIWFDLFRGSYDMDDLTHAIAEVMKHGSRQDRRYVEEIHKYLDQAQRQALARWLRASPYRLRRLQAALDKPLKTGTGRRRAGRSNSFLRRFLLRFGK